MYIKQYLLLILIFCSNFASGALMEDDGCPVARTQSLTEAFLPEAIIDAAKKGDLDFIKDYCQKNKLDLNLKSDAEGMTLLMYGCLYNRFGLVEWLLKEGADFRARHSMGRAIEIAADQGNFPIVKLLADADTPMRKNQHLLLLNSINNKLFKAFEAKNIQEWGKYIKIATYLHTINVTGTTYEAIYQKLEHEMLDQIKKSVKLPFPAVIFDVTKSYV